MLSGDPPATHALRGDKGARRATKERNAVRCSHAFWGNTNIHLR